MTNSVEKIVANAPRDPRASVGVEIESPHIRPEVPNSTSPRHRDSETTGDAIGRQWFYGPLRARTNDAGERLALHRVGVGPMPSSRTTRSQLRRLSIAAGRKAFGASGLAVGVRQHPIPSDGTAFWGAALGHDESLVRAWRKDRRRPWLERSGRLSEKRRSCRGTAHLHRNRDRVLALPQRGAPQTPT